MTDMKIRLTDEDFYYLQYNVVCIDFSKDDNDVDMAKELKQQILLDQKIREHIMNCSNCGSIGWSNCKYFRQNLDGRNTLSEVAKQN